MNDNVKVSIISDVVCPWCVIGYKRLEQAIKELGLQDQVEIEWEPFEINPDMPAEGEELAAHTARKYGSTPEESRAFRDQMTELGKEVGFKFDFYEGMRIVNTLDAHILLEYAKEKGLQTELKLRLFNACYNEHKNVSDTSVLMQEVEALGLDADEALAFMKTDEAQTKIKMRESFWQQQGVSGVPAMVFNEIRGLSGAQPVEVYKQVLTELIGE